MGAEDSEELVSEFLIDYSDIEVGVEIPEELLALLKTEGQKRPHVFPQMP